MAGAGEGKCERAESRESKGAKSEEQAKSDRSRGNGPKFVLALMSLISIGISVSPLAGLLSQRGAMSLLVVAIGSGLLIAAVSIEEVLTSKNYIGSASVKYAIGLIFAFSGYWGRKAALDDVNSIFHIDPGPLPMAVWAGTALNLASFLLIAFFFMAGFASLIVFSSNWKKGSASYAPPPASLVGLWRDEVLESTAWGKLQAEASAQPPPGWGRRLWIEIKMRWARAKRLRRIAMLWLKNAFRGWHREGPKWKDTETVAILISVLFSAVVGIFYVNGQLNEEAIRRKIYMIALSTDFNSKFECAEFDSYGMVGLFVGPDQSKVLLAPEYEEPWNPKKPFLIGMRAYPDRFPVLACAPLPPKLEDWKARYKVKARPPAKDSGPRGVKPAPRSAVPQ